MVSKREVWAWIIIGGGFILPCMGIIIKAMWPTLPG